MGKLEMHSNFQMESEKDQLRDGSVILKGILKEYDVTRTGFSGIGGGNTSLGRINNGRDLFSAEQRSLVV